MVTLTLLEFRDRLREKRALPEPSLRREFRLRAGASLRDVASYCGVTRQSVSLWERGERTPTGENLSRYLEALGVLRDEAA